MFNEGVKDKLEKLFESPEYKSYIEQLAILSKERATTKQLIYNDMFIVMPPNMGRNMIYESLKFCDGQNMVDLSNAIKSVSVELEYPQPSTIESEICNLKSQLKHCKNYLERQNIERKLNRLYKERNKNERL